MFPLRYINSGGFAHVCLRAGRLGAARFSGFCRTFREKSIPLANQDLLTLHSPGRINLIGEHTDYNQGFVLPAAINLGIRFRLGPNREPHLARIRSEDLDAAFSADLRHIRPGKDWENYLLGVLSQLELRGIQVPGFDCTLESDLPVGAGLSSSAALECGLAWGLNKLFGLGLENRELIELSQAAEHTYVGTQCGIMDQFACVMGQAGHFILLDCRSLEHRYIPAALGEYGLLLLNSGVTHSLAGSAYNRRREECAEGVALLSRTYENVASLRDATPVMLADLGPSMPETLYKRCRYVVEENLRVLEATRALEEGRIEDLGELLLETHAGLSKLYEVSCEELDFLVEAARRIPGVAGARMIGGGFGGCSLNLVRKEVIPNFISAMAKQYREAFGKELTPIEVKLGQGVSALPATR